MVKYVPTNSKDTLKKRSANDLSNGCLCYVFVCFSYFDLHRRADAIQMGIHNVCLYKEVIKKIHWL